MDIKWIEDFLSLAQTRSFSRSAEDRSVTQPALSRRIQALEAWVGTELVDRSTYPLHLTSAGKLFRDHAEEFLRALLDTRALLRGQQKSAGHVLQFTAAHTLSLNFLPPWLKRVQQHYPEISARVLATNVHDAVLALVEGGCDLMLCYHHPALPILLDADRYAYRSLGTERILPVSTPARDGRPRYALPGSKAEPVPYLAYTEGTFLGRTVTLLRNEAGQAHHLRPSHESDMAELLKKMALEGDGLAWLPESAIHQELADGRLVRAGAALWSMSVDIRLYRTMDNHKPALDRLWSLLPGIA